MKLRPATAADIPALHALETKLFPSDRLSLWSFRYHRKNARAFLRVLAGPDKIPAGYILVLYRGKTARLYSIALAPAAQGQGWGGKMMQAAIKDAKQRGAAKISLEVRARSHKVVKLYESF
ncbi:MAG: GNAT family N-acetyltransferase, partial [Alphaproteobacteria bacterium]|nr:GNAT family N-acetyltransferase [Alphaproteobacteria bacterium]